MVCRLEAHRYVCSSEFGECVFESFVARVSWACMGNMVLARNEFGSIGV